MPCKIKFCRNCSPRRWLPTRADRNVRSAVPTISSISAFSAAGKTFLRRRTSSSSPGRRSAFFTAKIQFFLYRIVIFSINCERVPLEDRALSPSRPSSASLFKKPKGAFNPNFFNPNSSFSYLHLFEERGRNRS